MVIETEQELIVKSGETETRYSGRDGRITTKAKYVTSQAEKSTKKFKAERSQLTDDYQC